MPQSDVRFLMGRTDSPVANGTAVLRGSTALVSAVAFSFAVVAIPSMGAVPGQGSTLAEERFRIATVVLAVEQRPGATQEIVELVDVSRGRPQ